MKISHCGYIIVASCKKFPIIRLPICVVNIINKKLSMIICNCVVIRNDIVPYKVMIVLVHAYIHNVS